MYVTGVGAWLCDAAVYNHWLHWLGLTAYSVNVLSHRQKCWSLIGWNRFTWLAL